MIATLRVRGDERLPESRTRPVRRAAHAVRACRRVFRRRPRAERVPPDVLSTAVNDPVSYDNLWRQAPEPLDRLELAYLEAQKYLVAEDAEMCKARIVDGVQRAALLLSGTNGGTAAGALLVRRNNEIGAFLQHHGTRRLMREYSHGLYWGIAASVLVLTTAGAAALGATALFGNLAQDSNLLPDSLETLMHSLICVAGGATGSTLSVLLRLRNNSDRLDYRMSGDRAAVVRIALGWFFAAAVLALVKGGILTLLQEPSIPAGAEGTFDQEVKARFFWAGIGMLAGFNERWARDLVTRQSEDTGGVAGKAPATPLPPAEETTAAPPSGEPVTVPRPAPPSLNPPAAQISTA